MKFLVSILMISIFVACKQESDTPQTAQEAIEIRLSHIMAQESPLHQQLVKLSQKLKEISNQQLLLKISPEQNKPGGQLITELKENKIDISIIPTLKYPTPGHQLKLLNLPFLLNHESDFHQAIQGPLGEYLKSSTRQEGLEILEFIDEGDHIIASKHPLEKRDSIQFQIANNAFQKKLLSQIGYTPVFVRQSEVKTLIEQGNGTTLETPISFLEKFTLKFPYTYKGISNKRTSGVFTTPNLKKKLSKAHYKLLIQAFHEFNSKWESWVHPYGHSFKDSAQSLLPLPEFVTQIGQKFRDSTLAQHPKFLKALNKSPRQDDLTLGLDLSLEGKTSPSGEYILAGVELALEEIHQKLNLDQPRIRPIALNNSGFPARGIKNLDSILKAPNLVAVFGGMHSPIAFKQLDIIHEAQVPFLIPWAAATGIIDNGHNPNFAFRLSVRDEYAGEFLVQEVVKSGNKKIALVLENSGWGRGNHKSMTKALSKRGLKATSQHNFDWGIPSFKDFLMEISQKEVDAILFVGNAPEGEVLIRDIAELKLDIPIYSHWGITGGDFYKLIKPFLKDVKLKFLQTFNSHKNLTPQQKIFFHKLREHLDLKPTDPFTAPVGAIHSYELTHILAQALYQDTIPKRSDLQQTLKKIRQHQGTFKNYQQPFKNLQEALSSKDLSLCEFDTQGNIVIAN